MPAVSQAQRAAMAEAAAGNSNLDIPKSVGKEFINADPGGKLPEHAKKDANDFESYKTYGIRTEGAGKFTVSAIEGKTFTTKAEAKRAIDKHIEDQAYAARAHNARNRADAYPRIDPGETNGLFQAMLAFDDLNKRADAFVAGASGARADASDFESYKTYGIRTEGAGKYTVSAIEGKAFSTKAEAKRAIDKHIEDQAYAARAHNARSQRV